MALGAQGRRLLIYTLEERIGEGSTGAVYRGQCAGWPVSIKVMRDGDVALREAMIMARLPSHDNVIPYRSLEQGEDGSHHLIRKWVPGITLTELLDAGRLSLAESLYVVQSILTGLDECVHNAGVVHRDLSPANIIIATDGDVLIGDFGHADLFGRPGTAGTIPYSSPEQLNGEPCGPASDLFAVGVLLYKMLTGKHPFGEYGHVYGITRPQPVSPPRTYEPTIPHEINRIVCRMLDKDSSTRYGHASEVLQDMPACASARHDIARRLSPSDKYALRDARAPSGTDAPGVSVVVLALLSALISGTVSLAVSAYLFTVLK